MFHIQNIRILGKHVWYTPKVMCKDLLAVLLSSWYPYRTLDRSHATACALHVSTMRLQQSMRVLTNMFLGKKALVIYSVAKKNLVEIHNREALYLQML
jgi:hypothetical protein